VVKKFTKEKLTFEMTSPEYVKDLIDRMYAEFFKPYVPPKSIPSKIFINKYSETRINDLSEIFTDFLKEQYLSEVDEDIRDVAKEAFEYGKTCLYEKTTGYSVGSYEKDAISLKQSRICYKRNRTKDNSPERKLIDAEQMELDIDIAVIERSRNWGPY